MTPCYLLEPAPRVLIGLRRFTFQSAGPCPLRPYGHDAEVPLEALPLPVSEIPVTTMGEEMREDPRWPLACKCGYVFQPEDQWQRTVNRLWRRSDTATLTTLAAAPPGAMWDATWYPMSMAPNSPDGRRLVVRTPAGDWLVDGPSTNGPGWTRTGTLPQITVRPSIAQPGYHGWLTDGVLHDA